VDDAEKPRAVFGSINESYSSEWVENGEKKFVEQKILDTKKNDLNMSTNSTTS